MDAGSNYTSTIRSAVVSTGTVVQPGFSLDLTKPDDLQHSPGRLGW